MPNPRILRLGSSGADVADWQRALCRLGYPVAVDGDFGPKTKDASERFQRARGLKVDGVVGAITRGEAASVLAALYPAEFPPAPVQPSPVPAGWQRWNGARPEPRGAPKNTILAVPGLDGVSPAFRSGLLDMCAEMGIPIDALATVICSESRFNPKALNQLPAAGLIQLTVGAGLPGFTNSAAVRTVISMSAEEQLAKVIRPYYARIKAAKDANPGHLYMLNFLPTDANNGESFQLGVGEFEEVEVDGKTVRRLVDEPKTWRGKVYQKNQGFDLGRPRRGYFTIGDVYSVAASICKLAKGKRVAVDGTVV
jgi:peptidoglycan hydrolase-like protein with peptidoglycan-binding domain